jgi:hypothetical protein
VKPDPGYHATKSDIQLFSNGVQSNIVPSSQIDSNKEQSENYDDYVRTYFAKIETPIIDHTASGAINTNKKMLHLSRKKTHQALDTERHNSPQENTDTESTVQLDNASKRATSVSSRTELSVKVANKRSDKKRDQSQPDSVKESKPGTARSTETARSGSGRKSRKTVASNMTKHQLINGSARPDQQALSSNPELNSTYKLSESHEQPAPLPEDPLLATLEPIEPTFWKLDFTVTSHKDYTRNNASDNEDEDEDDVLNSENDISRAYLSSRGEKRRRKFRSQIIEEGFYWKPERGNSIQLDSRFDLADIPTFSSEAFTDNAFVRESSATSDEKKQSTPSHVTAVISRNSIRAREQDKPLIEKEAKAKSIKDFWGQRNQAKDE